MYLEREIRKHEIPLKRYKSTDKGGVSNGPAFSSILQLIANS